VFGVSSDITPTELARAIVTFSDHLPPYVTALSVLKLKVRQYLPRPMRCSNCWAFGHTAKVCRNTPLCEQCGVRGHSLAECSHAQDESGAKCANCKGNHRASSALCPRYVDNKKYQTGTRAQPTTPIQRGTSPVWFGLVWLLYGTSAQVRPLVPGIRLNFVCFILIQITLYHAQINK
jgi:hypothetical protein